MKGAFEKKKLHELVQDPPRKINNALSSMNDYASLHFVSVIDQK